MSTFKDLQLLSDAAYYDRCNYVNYNVDNVLEETDKIKDGIYHAKAGSRDVPLFKILMTNQCNNDCAYCTNCIEHKYQRARLSPEALARIYMKYYESNMVEGLFLSSGIIKDADTTMEEMIEAAKNCLILINEINILIRVIFILKLFLEAVKIILNMQCNWQTG